MNDFIDFANELADVSGEVLRRYFRRSVQVSCKDDASPVTVADREAEAAIRALITTRYHDHGIFGEEEARRNPDAPLQWVIDPVDGTRAFLAGYPLFTTLISLVENGTPVLGIIDQPVLRERWLAVNGASALLNGQPVGARACKRVQDAVVATTSLTYFSPEERKQFDVLAKAANTVVYGGDAYAYAMLAGGQVDIVLDAAMKPYDFCALAPVVEGAGGRMTDWAGNAVRLTSKGNVLAVGDGELLDEVLSLL